MNNVNLKKSSISPEGILLTVIYLFRKGIFYLSPFSENFIQKSRWAQNPSRSSRLSSYLKSSTYVIPI